MSAPSATLVVRTRKGLEMQRRENRFDIRMNAMESKQLQRVANAMKLHKSEAIRALIKEKAEKIKQAKLGKD